MDYYTDINNHIDNIDIIMAYGIDCDEAGAFANQNSAEGFSRPGGVKGKAHPLPVSDTSMKVNGCRNIHANNKSRPKTRTLPPQSKENHPVLQFLNQTRIIVGREPFKGLVIVSMAGFLVRARLFR